MSSISGIGPLANRCFCGILPDSGPYQRQQNFDPMHRFFDLTIIRATRYAIARMYSSCPPRKFLLAANSLPLEEKYVDRIA
jgi:hypothetical protein